MASRAWGLPATAFPPLAGVVARPARPGRGGAPLDTDQARRRGHERPRPPTPASAALRLRYLPPASGGTYTRKTPTEPFDPVGVSQTVRATPCGRRSCGPVGRPCGRSTAMPPAEAGGVTGTPVGRLSRSPPGRASALRRPQPGVPPSGPCGPAGWTHRQWADPRALPPGPARGLPVVSDWVTLAGAPATGSSPPDPARGTIRGADSPRQAEELSSFRVSGRLFAYAGKPLPANQARFRDPSPIAAADGGSPGTPHERRRGPK